MKQILAKNFDNFFNNDTIFFIDNNIVVHVSSNSPMIKFKEIYQELEVAYLDEISNILFAQKTCNNESKNRNDSSDKITDKSAGYIVGDNYKVLPAKLFIRETTAKVMNHILRGLQWLTWEQKYIYCSKCGDHLSLKQNVIEKKCNNCNLSFFPSLAPAIMVLITRGNEILLARSPHFAEDIYSVIAGFIDIGETAEDAVHREVMEEVGLQVTGLKYFGSQSWPFPNSFMIAFTAEYLSGELAIATDEIEDAKWFSFDNLPKLPAKPSISRRLIDGFMS